MIKDSKNLSPAHLLDPSPEQIRSWANAAVELMAEYLGAIRDRPVYPHTSSRQIRERLDSSLPEEPTTFDELLHTFRDTLIELSRHNGHPRMFGYVQAPGTAIAALETFAVVGGRTHRSRDGGIRGANAQRHSRGLGLHAAGKSWQRICRRMRRSTQSEAARRRP